MTYTIVEGPQGVVTLDSQGPGTGYIFNPPVTMNQPTTFLAGFSTPSGAAASAVFPNGITVFNGAFVASGTTTVGALNSNGIVQYTGAATLAGLKFGSNGLMGTGGTSLGGSVTITNTATFVSGLNSVGDITLNRHIVSTGATVLATSAVGANASVTSPGVSNDNSGLISWMGTGTPAAGAQIIVKFVAAYATAPQVIIAPASYSMAGLNAWVVSSTTNFTLNTGTIPPTNGSVAFSYIITN